MADSKKNRRLGVKIAQFEYDQLCREAEDLAKTPQELLRDILVQAVRKDPDNIPPSRQPLNHTIWLSLPPDFETELEALREENDYASLQDLVRMLLEEQYAAASKIARSLDYPHRHDLYWGIDTGEVALIRLEHNSDYLLDGALRALAQTHRFDAPDGTLTPLADLLDRLADAITNAEVRWRPWEEYFRELSERTPTLEQFIAYAYDPSWGYGLDFGDSTFVAGYAILLAWQLAQQRPEAVTQLLDLDFLDQEFTQMFHTLHERGIIILRPTETADAEQKETWLKMMAISIRGLAQRTEDMAPTAATLLQMGQDILEWLREEELLDGKEWITSVKDFFAGAAGMAREVGSPLEGEALLDLCDLLVTARNWTEATTAIAQLRRFVDLRRDVNTPPLTAAAYYYQGLVALGQGQYQEAHSLLEDSITIAKTVGWDKQLAASYHGLARLALEEKVDLQLALVYYDTALEYYASAEDCELEMARLEMECGDMLSEHGAKEDLVLHYRSSVELFEESETDSNWPSVLQDLIIDHAFEENQDIGEALRDNTAPFWIANWCTKHRCPIIPTSDGEDCLVGVLESALGGRRVSQVIEANTSSAPPAIVLENDVMLSLFCPQCGAPLHDHSTGTPLPLADLAGWRLAVVAYVPPPFGGAQGCLQLGFTPEPPDPAIQPYLAPDLHNIAAQGGRTIRTHLATLDDLH